MKAKIDRVFNVCYICFGLDNISLMFGKTNGNTTNMFGVRANILELEIGLEGQEEIRWDTSSSTVTYSNFSINSEMILMLYAVTNGAYQTAPYAIPNHSYAS